MTILVVDDSIMVRKTMQKNIEKIGHNVILARNGQEAIDVYQEKKPDIVTMDLAMPVMSGMDALKHLIAIDPYAKVIMSTANNFSDLVLLAMKVGALGYLLKPVTIDALEKAINKVIDDTLKKEDELFTDV